MEPYICYICGKPVTDYTPEWCCDGTECACMGMPIEPPYCDECRDRENAITEALGK